MSRPRIAALDGIRAYAVSLVFMVHFLAQYFNGATGRRIDFDSQSLAGSATWVDALARYFWASHYGVDLFFLLSGFLILRIVSRPDFSYWDFLWSRFFRLYPAFLVAMGVYLLYIAKFWGVTFGLGTLLGNLLLLHGIWELQIKPIIVPTWSLTYEWLFYLVFPALLLLPGARPGVSHRKLLVCATLILAAAVGVGPHYMRFLMFLAGAALALTDAAMLRRFATKVPEAALVALYVAANGLFVIRQNWYLFIPVYLVTSALLVATAVHGGGILHRAACWAPLRGIGKVSYSFYLFHGLAVVVFCDQIGPWLGDLPEAARFAVFLAGSYLLSLLAACVSYALLEKPYFERKTRQMPALSESPAG